MKKTWITIAICVVLFDSCQTKTGKQQAGPLMPAFNLLLLDSATQLNTATISTGHPTVLLYFSPDCEHCQKETESILQHMDSLRQVHFYFITNDPLERMQVYNKMYKLYNYPNITLARDYAFYFPAHFDNVAPPYMALYDQNKRLRKIFNGETTAQTILYYINTL